MKKSIGASLLVITLASVGLLAVTPAWPIKGMAPAPQTPIPAQVVPQTPRPTVPMTPRWNRESCGDVCTIRYSPGGVIDEFLEQAWQVKKDDIILKIDGDCISACTMAADKARPNVCVTPRAVFRFHRGYEIRTQGESRSITRFDPSSLYSRDIRSWVDRHGGFPGRDADDQSLLDMSFAQAKRYFRTCA